MSRNRRLQNKKQKARFYDFTIHLGNRCHTRGWFRSFTISQTLSADLAFTGRFFSRNSYIYRVELNKHRTYKSRIKRIDTWWFPYRTFRGEKRETKKKKRTRRKRRHPTRVLIALFVLFLRYVTPEILAADQVPFLQRYTWTYTIPAHCVVTLYNGGEKNSRSSGSPNFSMPASVDIRPSMDDGCNSLPRWRPPAMSHLHVVTIKREKRA